MPSHTRTERAKRAKEAVPARRAVATRPTARPVTQRPVPARTGRAIITGQPGPTQQALRRRRKRTTFS